MAAPRSSNVSSSSTTDRYVATVAPLASDPVVQEAAKNYLSSTQISGVIVGESQTVKTGLAEFRSFEISESRQSIAKPASGN
jgi:hypothetical protein